MSINVEFQDLVWGEGSLSFPLTEKDFILAREFIIEELMGGKNVCVVVPEGTVITLQMMLFFIEMGNVATCSGVYFSLRICSKMIRLIEQIPSARNIILREL